MVKRLLLLLILMSATMGTYAQTSAIRSLYNKVTKTHQDTFETKADSMTHAFIESFMVKDKGYFNVSYKKYAFNAYWTQAHAMDVVIYNYERHKNLDYSLANKYRSYMTSWYNNKANNYAGASTSDGSYRMFENPYTDDMCWITLTLMRMGEATGTAKYFTAAKQVFDQYIIKRATEDEETGGLKLPWNTEAGSGPNACTQSPATLIAAKLYQKYGTAKYLEYAKKLYAYTSKKIVKSDGRVEEPPLTYTQGTFGEACRILYHVTDESTTMKNKYKSLAYTYINYAFSSTRCTSGNNILRDEGSSGDQSIFKAVLIPYAVNFVLDEDMAANNRSTIFDYIVKNTKMMWQHLDLSRYPIVFCNYDWRSTYTGADSDASMGAMCSGTSLMENTARMCRAIVDRYELSSLLTTCNKVYIDPKCEEEPVYAAFIKAIQAAEDIMASPGDYMTHHFSKAIENLEAAYQAVLAAKQEDLAIIDNTLLDIQEEQTYPHITYTRIYNGKWEPLLVPFAMKYEDWAEEYDVAEIFDFHQYDNDNDSIVDEMEMEVMVLRDSSAILPNRPYLIRAKSRGEKTLTLVDATAVATNDSSFNYRFPDYTYIFSCFYDMPTIAQTYTVQDGELVYSEEETSLPPQRWCMSFYANDLDITAPLPARISIITSEDYANGCIAPASSPERDKTIYDLSGRKVANAKNLPRGIYIIGGRKVLVR